MTKWTSKRDMRRSPFQPADVFVQLVSTSALHEMNHAFDLREAESRGDEQHLLKKERDGCSTQRHPHQPAAVNAAPLLAFDLGVVAHADDAGSSRPQRVRSPDQTPLKFAS
jgi:hypothetical protein